MLTPQAKQFLESIKSMNLPRIFDLAVTQVRANGEAFAPMVVGAPEKTAETRDFNIANTLDNVNVPVRFYRPEICTSTGLIIYVHGGGWMMGSLSTYDALCRRLSNRAEMCVLSVGYRLAPEHKYPAGLNDTDHVLTWAQQNAHELKIDANHILLAGDSAGGNLIAGVTVKRIQEKRTLSRALLMIYPSLDLTFSCPSVKELATGYRLQLDDMEYFRKLYLANDQQKLDPIVSPLMSNNIGDFPPTWTITAEYDPLKDDGRVFHEKLLAAGVPSEHMCIPGVIHAFVNLYAIFPEAEQALAWLGQAAQKAIKT